MSRVRRAELRCMCHRPGINPAYIDPGCPPEGKGDAMAERVCGEFPLTFARCVYGRGGFYGVKDAQVRLNGWRRYFNQERLHSRLGYLTPAEFAASFSSSKADEKLGDSTEGLPSAEPNAEKEKPKGESGKD